MKTLISSICLLAFATLLGGCVTRTYVDAPQHRGEVPDKKKFGSDPEAKVKGTKRVWVWQDEFRNP